MEEKRIYLKMKDVERIEVIHKHSAIITKLQGRLYRTYRTGSI
jgi:hypothetical protein